MKRMQIYLPERKTLFQKPGEKILDYHLLLVLLPNYPQKQWLQQHLSIKELKEIISILKSQKAFTASSNMEILEVKDPRDQCGADVFD